MRTEMTLHEFMERTSGKPDEGDETPKAVICISFKELDPYTGKLSGGGMELITTGAVITYHDGQDDDGILEIVADFDNEGEFQQTCEICGAYYQALDEGSGATMPKFSILISDVTSTGRFYLAAAEPDWASTGWVRSQMRFRFPMKNVGIGRADDEDIFEAARDAASKREGILEFAELSEGSGI